MSYEENVAEQIYRALVQWVPPKSQRCLKKVVVKCDRLDDLDPHKLATAWQQAAQGPAYRNSFVELHRENSKAVCPHCRFTFDLSEETRCCSRCGCEQFKIVHDPITIETYELE